MISRLIFGAKVGARNEKQETRKRSMPTTDRRGGQIFPREKKEKLTRMVIKNLTMEGIVRISEIEEVDFFR